MDLWTCGLVDLRTCGPVDLKTGGLWTEGIHVYELRSFDLRTRGP